MDARITVFLALVSWALLINTALLWVLAKRVRRSAEAVSRYRDQYARSIEGLRATCRRLETSSARLAEWSEQARAGVIQFGGECDRVENWLQYGLAKLDFNVEKASARIETETRHVVETVSEPLYRTATMIQGIKALLELLSLGLPKEGEGPRSAA